MKNNTCNINVREFSLRPWTGCGVCALVCHKSCITMHIDKDGFYVPTVENELCVECGRCMKVCVKYAKFEQNEEAFYDDKLKFSYKNPNKDILVASSSGVFVDTILSASLQKGYAVCGSVFHYENLNTKNIVTSSV